MISYRGIFVVMLLVVGYLSAGAQLDSRLTDENRLLYKDTWELGTKTVSNMSANIYEYSGMPDWYGLSITKTSKEDDGIAIGKNGVLLTPAVNSTSGWITIVTEMCSLAKNVKYNYFVVHLADPDTGGQMIRENGTFLAWDKDITSEWERWLLTIPADIPCRLMIIPHAAAGLRSIAVYDGEYSLDDVLTGIAQPARQWSNDNNGTQAYDVIGRPYVRGVRITKEKRIIK